MPFSPNHPRGGGGAACPLAQRKKAHFHFTPRAGARATCIAASGGTIVASGEGDLCIFYRTPPCIDLPGSHELTHTRRAPQE